MRRCLTPLIAATFFVSSLGAAPAAAAPVKPPPTATPDSAALQAALDQITASGMPGVFAEVRDGRRRWRGASGVADVTTGRPMRSHFQHRVGSITKTFVATTVLQLVAEGKISLDAPLGQYLPESSREGVTVRMLLNHTSGIDEYAKALFKTPDDVVRYQTETVRPRQLASLGLSMPPTGAPGAGWSYSNTGYILLGLIIEKVTGRPAWLEVSRRIIWPLGLLHTYFPRTNPRIVGPHSAAYVPWFGGELRDFSTSNVSWAWMAGELVSTTADLDRFYRALLTGRLLRPTELAQMKTVVPWNPSKPEWGGYGLGLISGGFSCGLAWGHGGLMIGHSTSSYHSPEGTRQVTIALNLTHYQAEGQPDPIAEPLARFLDLALCGPAAGGARSAEAAAPRFVDPLPVPVG